MGFSDSVAGCVAQCTGLHCERGGLGLGLWGFSDYLLLLSGAEAGEAGCAPFPQAVVELPWSLHAQLSDGSWARGLWCLLLPVCSQE